MSKFWLAALVPPVVLLTHVMTTSSPEPATPTVASCPVTLPNGNPPPGLQSGSTIHGNGALWVTLHEDGRIPVPPENITSSGWLGIKLPWWRAVHGALTIEARRLDGPASVPVVTVPGGYGDTGFQASAVLFPMPGCWEVTGRVGKSSLTFVALVEPATEADLALPTPVATPQGD